jgi:beta-glucosidase
LCSAENASGKGRFRHPVFSPRFFENNLIPRSDFMKKGLLCGLTATLGTLGILCAFGTKILYDNSGSVNAYLGLSASKIVTPEGTGEDTLYYRSSFGDGTLSAANLKKMLAATEEQNRQEMEEGAVLLKNADSALPLKETERTVALYGEHVHQPLNIGTNDNTVDFDEALKEGGFTVSDSADVALVMLSRKSGEGSELKIKDTEGNSELALTEKEKTLLTQARSHRKVVLLINASNPMELGWMDSETYGVDACLWIGGPGTKGCPAIVSLLKGESNPSGRLTDTYAVNSASAPSCVNGGTNTPRWSNLDYIKAHTSEKLSMVAFTNFQAENIYVGYKYYETRYEDAMLNRNNAVSAVGSSTGDSWNYQKEVTFPFGYGLSYSAFSESLDSVKDNGKTLSVQVTVTNTGTVSGKKAVEIYAQTPYGEYERENKVEKSAVQLVGFGKTSLLQPEASETLTLEISKYFLASYDTYGTKTYLLSSGDYYLTVAENAHEAVNNILRKKGISDLLDEKGQPVLSGEAKAVTWNLASQDKTSFASSFSGAQITNRFEKSDINTWIPGSLVYLSRSDWEGTYPKSRTVLSATDEMIQVLGGETYQKPADSPSYDSFKEKQDAGLKILDMKGIPFDDPRWETFLSQMTYDEMGELVSWSVTNSGIDSIVLPGYITHDGIDILDARYDVDGTSVHAIRYTDQVVLSSTWNSDLFHHRGEMRGEEMLFSGVYQNYGPGGDLHRNPFGGRNYEYSSEDADFTYLCTSQIVSGMQSKGVSAEIKHLAVNDQEYNRQGLCTFFTEQALREGSLRGFEGALTVGRAKGCMNGLNRIGLEWTNSCSSLCRGIIREEWGFTGIIETDGLGNQYQMHFTTSLSSGTNAYCLDETNQSGTALCAYLREQKDGYIAKCLRDSAKWNLYNLANSIAMNGLSKESHIVNYTPWWQPATTALLSVFAVAEAGCLVFYLLSLRKGKVKHE